MSEEVITINDDELIGYIMRKTKELRLSYEEVECVLSAEEDFLRSKGIISTE